MKYTIKDTIIHTLGEIEEYFKKELLLTSLKKEDIIIDDTLKTKLAMLELERIFDTNGLSPYYELDINVIHLKGTGHTIEFSENEINSRFDDIYSRILTDCEEIILTEFVELKRKLSLYYELDIKNCAMTEDKWVDELASSIICPKSYKDNFLKAYDNYIAKRCS